MIINNRHLLENRKRSLHDPRLPLTPAELLGLQPGAASHAHAGELGSRWWAGHMARGQRRLGRKL